MTFHQLNKDEVSILSLTSLVGLYNCKSLTITKVVKMSEFDIDEHIRKSRERVNLFGTVFDRKTGSTVAFPSVPITDTKSPPTIDVDYAIEETLEKTKEAPRFEHLPRPKSNSPELSMPVIEEKLSKTHYILGGNEFEISNDTLWGFCFMAENFLKKEQINQFEEVFNLIKHVESDSKSLDLTRIMAYLTSKYNEYLESESPLTSVEANHFNILRKWRWETSKEEGYPPYVIADDSTLKNLIKKLPKNKEELLKVKGFGLKRVDKYGEELLAIVKSFAG